MKNSAIKLVSFLFVSCVAIGQNSVNNEDLALIDNSISQDTLAITKSSEMLNEDLYWAIIESSIKQTNNQEDQELFLISEIEKLSPKEMIGFRLRTDKLLFDTYNENLWCGLYYEWWLF